MQPRLSGKVIVVAGAGGIGDELARRYCAEGALVVLGDIDGDRAKSVATSIGAAATGSHLDGGDENSIKAIVDLAVATYGGLDGFHANYATFPAGERGTDILGMPMEVWDEVMRVNSRGFLLCTRHALPHMIKRGGGAMVYTSSGAAYQGEVVRLAYAMSKVSLHALMRHVARAFGPQGIRANVISPGVIAHGRFYEQLPEDVVQGFYDTNLFKNRLGEPRDIAAMGALLMADEGSFITGQVINVDGGGLMRA
ncbi:MAG: SDR family oxidoreductase [Novosphingobium sp.]